MASLIPRETNAEHAILLSHSEYVKLEWCPFTGVYFLVHTGTQQVAELPPDYCGQWMLQFTNDGWGYVVDEQGRIEKVHNSSSKKICTKLMIGALPEASAMMIPAQ